MSDPLSRREALKQLGAAGASVALGARVVRGQAADITVAGRPVEIAVASLSAVTVRLTVRPLDSDQPVAVPVTGALEDDDAGKVVARGRRKSSVARVRAGDLVIRVETSPPTIHVETRTGSVIQRFTLDAAAPGMSFLIGDAPLLGFGEGGPQFDRRGSTDRMVNGQGGYRLATHGGRAPIQWLIGTSGFGLFIHQPYGTFDLSGPEGRFLPPADSALPLDVFVVASREPAVIMREYARITGLPEMPPRWSLGYLQSHRTLAGPQEILDVASTFRAKKLPCDALIYLGTEFTPSGWNTRNGEFTWHATNFPDPKKILDALHAEHFRVVMHTVIEGRRLLGKVDDRCDAPEPSGRAADNRWPSDRHVGCYWPYHQPLMELGVDGWWPDQGDGYDGPSRFNRHRMYFEGSLKYRPNERPFALHRNASAGVQRFASFLWSGDVQSRWETLATHVPVAVNTGLSGLSYWGTDIGGFIPTAEYTGELYVRWFQFGAFCPLFRAHGRHWHLRLPWGWNGGDGGPEETTTFRADPAQLHNESVEPICRKYLELRYRLMPYLYTAVRDGHETGLPIIRALWLHYADDPAAVARGSEYLWGRDLLVAPVVEKGAAARRLYLPRGTWIDFWTEERVEGGRELDRAVDLATVPLYARAGSIVPMGPVRQYTDEPTDEPMTIVVYPGADGESSWYDDDGKTFAFRRGEWVRVTMTWRDAARRLTLRLAPGSRMLSPRERAVNVRVAGSAKIVPLLFTGRTIDVRL